MISSNKVYTKEALTNMRYGMPPNHILRKQIKRRIRPKQGRLRIAIMFANCHGIKTFFDAINSQEISKPSISFFCETWETLNKFIIMFLEIIIDATPFRRLFVFSYFLHIILREGSIFEYELSKIENF